jgi:hypothetical protein
VPGGWWYYVVVEYPIEMCMRGQAGVMCEPRTRLIESIACGNSLSLRLSGNF